MAVKRGHARVVIDEIAFAEDIVRSGRTGATILREARRRYERGGVAVASLRACEAEGRDGTELPDRVPGRAPALARVRHSAKFRPQPPT